MTEDRDETTEGPPSRRARRGPVELATRRQLRHYADQAGGNHALASYSERALVVARLIDGSENAGEIVRLSKTLDDLLRRFEPRESARGPEPTGAPPAAGGDRGAGRTDLESQLGAGPEVGHGPFG